MIFYYGDLQTFEFGSNFLIPLKVFEIFINNEFIYCFFSYQQYFYMFGSELIN